MWANFCDIAQQIYSTHGLNYTALIFMLSGLLLGVLIGGMVRSLFD
jgi:hypothetical protein